jgi:ribosomal protein L6P/L9E
LVGELSETNTAESKTSHEPALSSTIPTSVYGARAKGKGIKYMEEVIRRKAGKAAKAA